jgi:cardiolipin synthase (CMP-forming)
MWLAHLLTLSRLPLALAFWAVVSRPGPAFVVLGLAAATDLIDGVIARWVMRRRQQAGQAPPSRLGEWLDPLCDKTFVVSALAAVTVHLQPPLWLPLALATRELILVPLAAVYRFTPLLRSRMRYRFRAGAMGKAATVVQFLAISALLLRHPLAPAAALVAALVGLLAALIYIRRGIRMAAGNDSTAAS